MTEQEQDTAEFRKRRRSERLYLSIPIRVFGTDPNARDFCEDTVTIAVSRHGARIRLENPLVANDEILITNLGNDQEDQFRVVGQASKPRPDNPFSDWGVECQHPEENIWDVEFKDSPEDAGAASALLECCSCNDVVSAQLAHEELDALSLSQLISRPCTPCKQTTFWRPASTDRRQHEVAAVAKALEAAGLPQPIPSPPPPPPLGAPRPPAAAPSAERRTGEDRRQERRIAVRVPIRIRTAEGSIEVTKTENLSKTGARFLSEKDYSKGTTLFVAVPYATGQEPLETKAVVEAIEELPGSVGKLFGINFEPVPGRR